MCACSLFKAIFIQLKPVFYSGSINPQARAKKKLALTGKNNGKLLFILLLTNHTGDYWPEILKSALMF